VPACSNVRRINCRFGSLLEHRDCITATNGTFPDRVSAEGGRTRCRFAGASSIDELDVLAARLMTDPDAVCAGQSPHCAVFPQACTVSLEIEIVVNGASMRAS